MTGLLSYDSNKTTFIYCHSPYSQSHSYSFQNTDNRKRRGRRFKMNIINNCQHKSSSDTVSFSVDHSQRTLRRLQTTVIPLCKNQENLNTCKNCQNSNNTLQPLTYQNRETILSDSNTAKAIDSKLTSCAPWLDFLVSATDHVLFQSGSGSGLNCTCKQTQ